MKSKYDLVVSDPPWNFSDSLSMSKVKRSAKSQYDTLSFDDIKNLPVKDVVSDDAILALWVPGSMLQEGLDVMAEWGFKQKQTHIWVKVKKSPLEILSKSFDRCRRLWKKAIDGKTPVAVAHLEESLASEELESFNLYSSLAFGMGHIFRQSHELCLIGTRGKVSKLLKNKSQRSVHFGPVTKHSAKPEDLQDMLDVMYPDCNKLEMFARRSRDDWTCLGNQSPESSGEDIRDSFKRIIGDNEKNSSIG